MKYDVAALGELLIDFTQHGESEQGNPLFEANPGGAPCNVLAMLAKLGRRTAFIGKVGEDMFGHRLRETVADAMIDTAGLVLDPQVRTTLAFVHTAPDGDRDFSFFRNPGADQMLTPAEVNMDIAAGTRIFHFGSLSTTHEPARSATAAALKAAREGGALISFDPNLRPPLWPNMDAALEQIAWGCSVADILKIAEEELAFLCGTKTIPEGVAELLRRWPGIALVFVTKGREGSEVFWRGLHAAKPSHSVKTIDTTGAGDTFCGACLSCLLDFGLEELDEAKLGYTLAYANAAAALVTTRWGAIKAMPDHAAITALMQQA